MTARKLWMLAAFVLAGCGGSNEPANELAPQAADQGIAAEDASSTAETQDAVAEPELVSSDANAPATGRFQLGVNYERLSPTQPTSSNPDQVEVAEVFWYGCPHCFHFDPLVEQWRQSKADYIHFIRIPAVWNPTLQIHARAFYTAEALGKGNEMHTEFFKEIHERGNFLDTEAKLQEFFGRFGVDAAAFKGAFDSFAVHSKLQRADELNRRYRVNSVPTIIINGKYTTDGGQAGSYEDLLELIDTLAAAEHAAQ
jgi:thiol:disulfide interchange protein DsbA